MTIIIEMRSVHGVRGSDGELEKGLSLTQSLSAMMMLIDVSTPSVHLHQPCTSRHPFADCLSIISPLSDCHTLRTPSLWSVSWQCRHGVTHDETG